MSRATMTSLLLATLFALVCLGCGGSSTPATHFNANQAGTMTPHGRVIEGSAEDVAPGRIRYATEGGTFEADAIPDEGDGYRYANVEQIASEPVD